jgi:hypothetical protein
MTLTVTPAQPGFVMLIAGSARSRPVRSRIPTTIPPLRISGALFAFGAFGHACRSLF